MSLAVCVLASGSSGNCTYVGSEHTRILIDAGLSFREIETRLESIRVDPATISAVCVTHEHSDHTACLGVLQRRRNVSLYANSGTIEAVELTGKIKGLTWNVFSTGAPFTIGDLRLEPFSVPHDSYDPVGFVVACGPARVGIVTDMGIPTELIRERLRRCQVVVIEANHDEELLKDSPRPWALKQRIAGRQGHLSNVRAGELMADVAGDGLQTVFLAHMSEECNRPELAFKTVARALSEKGHPDIVLKFTYPDRVSDRVEI